jgi:hypothetical protein
MLLVKELVKESVADDNEELEITVKYGFCVD